MLYHFQFFESISFFMIQTFIICDHLFQISPVGLIILSVVSFRWCRFSEMFDWSTHSGYLYLPSWVREIGAMMQLLPLLLVPFVGVIQSCRYFLNGQGPLHERINLLYRPSYEAYTNRLVKLFTKDHLT